AFCRAIVHNRRCPKSRIPRMSDLHPRTASADSVAHAYGLVRAAILDGRRVAATIVPKQQLAATLNVSRTPLREALRLLQMEGLIDAEANKQMRVVAIDRK